MKLKNPIIMFAAAAVAAACTNAVEPYDAVYITEAQNDMSKTVTIDTPPDGTSFSISSSVLASENVDIELEVNPELIEEYNSKYGKNYRMAPEDSFVLSSFTTSISKGYNKSDGIDVTVVSLDEFEEGATYCIPVSIKSVSAMKILEPSKTLFIVLRTPVISKAIYLGSGNKYNIPSFRQDPSLAALSQLTLETRVLVKGFCNSNPYISSIMGIEGICGMRFGDVKIPKNCVQICHESYQPAAANNLCTEDVWYHIAAVWTGSTWDIYIDGEYITGVETKGETIDLTSDNSGGFHIGASYGGGRPINGYVAETRVWTRALSKSEIANNMNYVDPQSPGLLAYWRMNKWEAKSGGGNIVKDETGHGYDAIGGSSSPSMIDTKWM